MTEIIASWAEFYAANKEWSIFPVHGWDVDAKCCTCGDATCSNAGKHPANKNGFKAADKNEFIVSAWFDKGDRNIGLATGSISGVFVLDVDGEIGERSLRELEKLHGTLPATLVCTTGGGRHIYFNMPPVDISCSTSRVGDKLDIRANGGYTILPPSMHRTGVEYRWVDSNAPVADAPKWLIDLAAKKKETRPEGVVQSQHVWDRTSQRYAEIESATNALDPDMAYEDWVRVGMAIKAAGGSFEIWNDWSAKGQKYIPAEMSAKWNSLSQSGGITGDTLEWMAREAGWENPMHEKVQIDLDGIMRSKSSVQIDIEERRVGNAEPEPVFSGWPFDPLKLSGPIGDTVRWISGSTRLPVPELDLLATLSALGGVAGRRYRLVNSTMRPNLYTIGLAATGAGKNHARKLLKELMVEAGLSAHIGNDDFVSASGLRQQIYDQPSAVMFVDEVGLVMQGMKDRTAGSYKKEISTLLMKLYSDSGSANFSGGRYADAKKKSVIINYPCLSIFGCSTPEAYIAGLTREMVTSGDLNRWVVLPSRGVELFRGRGYYKAPEAVRAAWQDIERAIPPMKTSTEITSVHDPDRAPEPIVVEFESDEIYELSEDMFVENVEKGQKGGAGENKALWVRYYENSMKIAMIFAIARNPAAPRINESDLQIGSSMVRASISYMISVFESEVSENLYQSNFNATRNILKASGPISRSDLGRRVQKKGLSARDLDAVLEDMMKQELIVREIAPTKGRPKEEIKYVG